MFSFPFFLLRITFYFLSNTSTCLLFFFVKNISMSRSHSFLVSFCLFWSLFSPRSPPSSTTQFGFGRIGSVIVPQYGEFCPRVGKFGSILPFYPSYHAASFHLSIRIFESDRIVPHPSPDLQPVLLQP